MQTRYLVGIVLCGSAIWAAAGAGNTTRSSLEFTRAAPPPPSTLDLKPIRSVSHLLLPVDLSPLLREAETELPDTLATLTQWLPDAACGKRNIVVDCTTAKVEGTITRDGTVAMQTTPTGVKLSIPIKYALSASGTGWARHLTEQKSGQSNLEIAFSVTSNALGGFDIARRDPAADEAPVPLLRANLRLSRVLDPQLKPFAKAAEDSLRRALTAVPIKAAMDKTWPLLAQPVELGRGSGAWLKTMPEVYAAGSLVSLNGKTAYQIPIVSRLTITEAEKAPISTNRQTATLSQVNTPDGPSRVRVVIPVDLETMRQQADRAFGGGQVFENRADRFSEPVSVKVKETRVYPALNAIGLQLTVDVTTSKGQFYNGKLHLIGRPVIDVAKGTVTLADVSFPVNSAKPPDGQQAGIPRLGIEPFASTFIAAAKLDVAQPLADTLKRGQQMLNQRLSDDLSLHTTFSETVPVSFESVKDGGALVVDLVGDVAFVYEGTPGPAVKPEMPAVAALAATPIAASPLRVKKPKLFAEKSKARADKPRKYAGPRQQDQRRANSATASRS